MSLTPKLRAQIQKALDLAGNTHTVEDLLLEVLSGNAKMWETENSIIIASILEFPQKRVLEMWVAAGELNEILEAAEKVYQWGRDHGCTLAVISGRKGWTKPLASHGWEPVRMDFTKEL